MSNFVTRSRYRLHWRLFARVAPVIGAALLVLGAFGWWSARQMAHQALCGAQDDALVDLDRAVRSAALVEALGLDSLPGGQPCGNVLAVVPQADIGRIVLTPTLDTPPNRTILADWLAAWIGPDGRDVGWPRPVILPGTVSGLQVVCHAPLILEDTRPAPRAVLPVLVRHGTAERPAVVGMLDLMTLVPTDRPWGEWWCIVAADGRIVAESPGGTVPPADLRKRAAAATTDAPVVGAGGWLVTRRAAPNLPLEIMIAGRPAPVPGTIRSIHFVVAALVLLTFVGAGLAAEGVLGDMSRRLLGLGEAMEDLARGQDSRRLDPAGNDDVTRLETWFNLVAVGLDEAHRTVHKKEAHLSSALKNMRMLGRAKDEFLELVSHEVRTPLTCIMGGMSHLESVLAEAEESDRAAIENLNLSDVVEVISNSSRRLSGFLTDILQITTIQSRDCSLELSTLTPAVLLEPILAGVRSKASLRGITVTDDLSPHDDWALLVDARILQVAVTKLVDNAIVHNADGGRVVLREVQRVPDLGDAGDLVTEEGVRRLQAHPSFEHWAGEELRWRILEVHNTGRAIPADRMDALFGKFEIVGPIANHSRGSGLSLPIARAAVEQHGGRLLVTSGDGAGTSFYLLLPTLPADAVPDDPRGLWDDLPESIGRRALDEEIRVMAHTAGFEIELDDRDAPAVGETDQAGSGVDGTGRSDHEKEPAL